MKALSLDHSKDLANVNRDRQTDRRTGQKLYAPNLLIWGGKKGCLRNKNIVRKANSNDGNPKFKVFDV
jgi:hypothetical protein